MGASYRYNPEKFSFPLLPTIDFAIVQWRDAQLPAWLFEENHENDDFVSPASAFTVDSALDGAPWQPTTTPNAERQPKALLIDRRIYKYGLMPADIYAQIIWFQSKNIAVYLCLEKALQNHFVNCQDADVGICDLLNSLGKFNSDADYESLAKEVQLARDSVVTLDDDKAHQLYVCLHQNKRCLLPSTTSNAEEQRRNVFDVSSYEVSVPYIIKDGNTVIKANGGVLNPNEIVICDTPAALCSLCDENPKNIAQLLQHNAHLINHALVIHLYGKYHSLRHIIMPVCYQKLGTTPKLAQDGCYWLALQSVIHASEIDLTALAKGNLTYFKKIIVAFPELGLRFEELLMLIKGKMQSNISDLIMQFPHRLYDIIEAYPPQNLFDLVNYYLKACPLPMVDPLIQKFYPQIKQDCQTQDGQRYLLLVIKQAQNIKLELMALLEPDTIKKSQINLIEANCPAPETWLTLGEIEKISRSVLIDIAHKAPDVFHFLIENTAVFSGVRLNCVKGVREDLARKFYEKYSSSVIGVDDVISLLRLYPEHYLAIIDQHRIILREADIVVTPKLPLHITIELSKQFPKLRILSDQTFKDYHPINLEMQLDSLANKDVGLWLSELMHCYQQHQCLLEEIVHQDIMIGENHMMIDSKMFFLRRTQFGCNQREDKDKGPAELHKQVSSLLHTPLVFESCDSLSFLDCTKLTIGMLDENLEIDLALFANVRHLSINLVDAAPELVAAFFNGVQQHCSKLTSIDVPSSMKSSLEYLPYHIKYHQRIFDNKEQIELYNDKDKTLKNFLELTKSCSSEEYKSSNVGLSSISTSSHQIAELHAQHLPRLADFGGLSMLRASNTHRARLNAHHVQMSADLGGLSMPITGRYIQAPAGRNPSQASRFSPAGAHSMPQPAPRSLSDIYVSSNPLEVSTSNTSNANQQFQMQKRGELLNAQGQEPHLIRTAVLQLSEDFLIHQEVVGVLTPQPMPVMMTPEVIAHCKIQNSAHFYYKLQTKVTPGCPDRLLSVDAEEEIIAISAMSADVQLFRGGDDFYYVSSDNEIELEYILKAQAPSLIDGHTRLSEDDLIFQIIDAYKSSPDYKKQSLSAKVKWPTETMVEWFERLYQTPGGSCKDRCHAVWYQIQKNIELRDRIRLVQIDRNHVRLEIKTTTGKWLQVDMGGIRSNLKYEPTLESSKATPEHLSTGGTGKSEKKDNHWLPRQEQEIKKRKLKGSSTYTALKQKLKDNKIPIKVVGMEALLAVDGLKIMMIHSDRQRAIAKYLQAAKQYQHPVFLLQSPKDIKVGKDQVHLFDGRSMISKLDALDIFLRDHVQNPKATLLFDWGGFNTQAKVALNTALYPMEIKMQFLTSENCH